MTYLIIKIIIIVGTLYMLYDLTMCHPEVEGQKSKPFFPNFLK